MLHDIWEEFGPVYVLAVLACLAIAVYGLLSGLAAQSMEVVGITVPNWLFVALFGVLGLGGAIAAWVRTR